MVQLRRWYLRVPTNFLMIATVVLPTLVAIIYYGIMAADVYVSESRFVVRSQQRQDGDSVLSSFLRTSSFGRSQDDAWVVSDYVLSLDALRALDTRLQLRKRIGAPNGDFVSRFPAFGGGDTSYEHLLEYYRNHVVSIVHDSTSGITTLKTSAFDAQSAHAINEQLLAMSEALVNELNRRAQEDEMRYARSMVEDAQNRVKSAALVLSEYRMTHAVFDPDRQSSLQLQQIGRLQEEMVSARARLAEVTSVAPDNPQIASLKTRIALIQQEMDAAAKGVTGRGDASLAAKSKEFERLNIEKAFADRQLVSALAVVEQARGEAAKKQLYIARVVQPGLPDAPEEPRRLRSILVTFVMGLVTWGLLSLLLAGVREHTLE
jgi:capsular polysaccharide transport system permease protein